ncbi:hypothetical protein UFOVP840_33 [uncultured Caudovirales phage]|uniref:Uncharacterized protein n=1 Tax=uncultured Caudovirales phage TaxID=2100421 RepID=A0A6J5P5Y5_9CAUD|nr:hypothetical protein UFOVP840_33 [uncultured Caudovirales phage]
MDDNLMFQYLVEQGSMRPEEEQMLRRQDTIDALRQQSMQAPQAQQAGRLVVAPSWTQGLAQLGSAAAAKYGQGKLDKQYGAFNAKRATSLDRMRDRMAGPQSVMQGDVGLPGGVNPDDLLSGLKIPGL